MLHEVFVIRVSKEADMLPSTSPNRIRTQNFMLVAQTMRIYRSAVDDSALRYAHRFPQLCISMSFAYAVLPGPEPGVKPRARKVRAFVLGSIAACFGRFSSIAFNYDIYYDILFIINSVYIQCGQFVAKRGEDILGVCSVCEGCD